MCNYALINNCGNGFVRSFKFGSLGFLPAIAAPAYLANVQAPCLCRCKLSDTRERPKPSKLFSARVLQALIFPQVEQSSARVPRFAPGIMPSKVGSEITGRKTPQRARLSDITNTAPVSLSKHREDDHLSKGCETQLHKEVANLRKSLTEKEELIQAQKINMEKLWANYTRKTKQNEDVIRQNGCLYKDLMQARDRLKILQHENAQMAAAHKVIKSELQAKLAKALEQTNSLGLLTNENVGACGMQVHIPNVLAKLAESRARRAVSSSEPSNELLDLVKEESLEHSVTSRTTSRRRASLNYKEPSLKTKLRQADIITSQVKTSLNQRESRVHHLPKLSEEDFTPAVTQSRSEDQLAEASFSPGFQSTPQTNSSSLSQIGCCSEDKANETTLPSIAQSATQAKSASSSAVPGAKLEGQGFSSSSVAEANVEDVSCVEQPPRTTWESSSLEVLPSGRPCRRSVGSIASYKEVPLNTKMRRS